jgi:hypothetical protein
MTENNLLWKTQKLWLWSSLKNDQTRKRTSKPLVQSQVMFQRHTPLQEKGKQMLAVKMQKSSIKTQCKLSSDSVCWHNLVVPPWDFKGVNPSNALMHQIVNWTVQCRVWSEDWPLACQLKPVAWILLVLLYDHWELDWPPLELESLELIICGLFGTNKIEQLKVDSCGT